MSIDVLNEDNFVLYAASNYDNPGCPDTAEFYEDLKRFKYLKKLFKRYTDSGELKERLILNHIIILYNMFGPVATTRMLFLKLDGFHKYLKPFVVMLNYMPDKIPAIGEASRHIISSDIPLDQEIVGRLRKI